MNLSKNIKIAIISFAVLIVFIMNLNYVFIPNTSKFKEKGMTLNEKKSLLGNLESLKQKEIEIQKEEKFLKYAFNEMDKKLPRYLVPESFISIIKDTVNRTNSGVEQKSKLMIQDITFTNPVEYKDIKINPPQALSIRVDQEISKYISSYANENIANNETPMEPIRVGEIEYKNIPDDKVMNVDLTLKISGGYQQVKNFISQIENANNVMAVKSITISSGKEDGLVDGSAEITIFGYKNDRLPIYSLWDAELKKGKVDIFSSEGSNRFDIDDSSIGDFKINVNRANNDAPTIIMGKKGAFGTEIYGDDNGTEEVELYITESNNKLFYKYKTRSSSYPADYSKLVEFAPSVDNSVVIKVFSTPRVANDDSGMNLTIYKQTNKNVEVKVYNDDVENPRVKYNFK